MSKPAKLIASIVLSFAAGGIGSLATSSNISTWYMTLEKAAFNPPNWVFGPVWSVLYLLMGISLYLVWTTVSTRSKRSAFIAFGIQLALNTSWSLVFFGLHVLWVSIVIIVVLLGSISATIKLFHPISKQAAYLLVPYLLWVCFAATLNIAIALLN